MLRLPSFLIASACLAVFAGTAAQAQSSDSYLRQASSATVHTSDLNLTTADGRRLLERRLRAASSAICVDDGIKDLNRLRDEARCRREAQRSVETQVASTVAAAGRRDVAAIAAR